MPLERSPAASPERLPYLGGPRRRNTLKRCYYSAVTSFYIQNFGCRATQADGAAQQVKGKVEKAWGNVKDSVKDADKDVNRDRDYDAERP